MKGLNLFLDLIFEKSKSIYIKIFKNDHPFFILTKYFQTGLILILLNIYFYSFYFKDTFEMLISYYIFSFSFVGILLTIFFVTLINDDNKKVSKLTDMEWEYLKNYGVCYHITKSEYIEKISKDNYIVDIHPTKYMLANINVGCRKSTYFFLNKPTKEEIVFNNLSGKKDYMITVKLSDMDRKRIRIRRKTNVLVYIGGYKGKGIIEKLK